MCVSLTSPAPCVATSDTRVGAADASQQIILHEDKKYFRSAEDVYGPDVETLVEDEDARGLDEPIVAPKVARSHSRREAAIPATSFAPEYLVGLLGHPDRVRNVALVGHLHHGKTGLIDVLVRQTHAVAPLPVPYKDEPHLRYTDARRDEQSREISIKAKPISLVLPDSRGRSQVLNIMDTPGHVNFSDEVACALRLADGVFVVVDALEGLLMQTRRVLRAAVAASLPIVLLINKIDRLILEVRIPPADAYFKLRRIIDEVNDVLAGAARSGRARVDPLAGTVLFASGLHGWIFSLGSFARLYADLAAAKGAPGVDAARLAKRMWGDAYFNPTSRTFARSPAAADTPRSFVQFVLEPLYKIYAHTLGAETSTLAPLLASLGVTLSKDELRQDPRPLLRTVCERVFGDARALVDAACEHLPSPVAGARAKIESCYTGALAGSTGAALLACDASGPLLANVVKLYPSDDCSKFGAFARILSGRLAVGARVKVLGEAYEAGFNEEDCRLAVVGGLAIFNSRYSIPVDSAPAGCWVLIDGVDESILKTATLCSEDWLTPSPCRALTFDDEAVVKLSVEPLNPSELPRMMEGLRKIGKTYPLLEARVEESGEHVILGPGELYLDCAMHDLRKLYANVEVKVSDPVVRFCETVADVSSLKCFADTPNARNKFTMIAEPLDRGLAEEIESGRVSLSWPADEVAKHFQTTYDWDVLAARSIWAFGPDASTGPNVLLDDTLPFEVDKDLLGTVRQSAVQGFRWAARDGPLCGEPMRNVKFRLVEANIAGSAVERSAGQVIPTVRRVAYASFLMATPRLMEPMYFVEIFTPADCIAAVYNVLAQRRGYVDKDMPQPGSPHFVVHGYVPVIDSFGFETDLRVHTQGQAFCMAVFDHWEVLRSDPLDTSISLTPLEPAPPVALARDFMLKVRRRRGLDETVSVAKYFTDPKLLELARKELGL